MGGANGAEGVGQKLSAVKDLSSEFDRQEFRPKDFCEKIFKVLVLRDVKKISQLMWRNGPCYPSHLARYFQASLIGSLSEVVV